MKNLLLFGFLLLATVASAQDQIRTVSGKIYNCDITDADQIFIYYRDSEPTVQRVPVNSVQNVFVSDSIKIKTLFAKSASFKILYENQMRVGGLGGAVGGFPELLNEAGRNFEKGSTLILAGTGISIAGSGIGLLVGFVDPVAGLIITGIGSLVASITIIAGHVKNLEGGRKLRQAGDAAIREKEQAK